MSSCVGHWQEEDEEEDEEEGEREKKKYTDIGWHPVRKVAAEPSGQTNDEDRHQCNCVFIAAGEGKEGQSHWLWQEQIKANGSCKEVSRLY